MGLVLFLLVLIGLIGWAWSSQLKAKEQALKVSKNLCEAQHVQWLDDTVALSRLRVMRVAGQLKVLRGYTFDYLDEALHHQGQRRTQGYIELLGQEVYSKRLSLVNKKAESQANVIDLASFQDKNQR